MAKLQATAILLAGGKASRMGTNKALLPIEGKANIEVIKEALAPFFSHLLLVTNDFSTYQFLNIPMIQDEFVEKGPLAGIHAGLKNTQTEVNFVVACDMPFVSGQLAKHLVEISGQYDAVVPTVNGTLHPLFAVYKKQSLDVIEQCLKANHLRIRDFVKQLDVFYIDELELKRVLVGNIEKIFYNMNYPSDYQQVKKWTEE